MSYAHITKHCFKDQNAQGLDHGQVKNYIDAIPSALSHLRAQADADKLPLLKLPFETDDLDNIHRKAETLRKEYDTLLVIGTGGSSLGGKTLLSLISCNVVFLENTDPHSVEGTLKDLDLEKTACLIISKSGSTVETLSLVLCFIDALKHKSGERAIAKQCLAITIPGDNPLRTLAERYGFDVIDHDPALGGRFSVFSEVGLLPAAFAGLDIAALRKGAASVITEMYENPNAPVSKGAAIQVAFMQQGKPITVMMPYCDRLKCYSTWFQQIWAESLGKEGKGSTPISALGAIDQHSQLQLYLDGPQDKFFTLITLNNKNKGPIVNASGQDQRLSHIIGQNIGTIMAALQQGTIDTLMNNECPLRIITLDTLDEYTLGALMMHVMLETILAAHLLDINAFDQPAVEESKQRARDYLNRKHAA
jgi:glucose-6-phosphate isomerase